MTCEVCDRPRAGQAERDARGAGVIVATLCYSLRPEECTGQPVDWRAIALKRRRRIEVLETALRSAIDLGYLGKINRLEFERLHTILDGGP